MTRPPLNLVFTITAGRTGTTYLYQLLRENIPNNIAYHERTGTGTLFGIQSPDIQTLANFNNFGTNNIVLSFFITKFSMILDEMMANDRHHYIETSHILWKAGLLEASEKVSSKSLRWNFIYLKRDFVKTMLSYYHRYDFYNIVDMWLWYLEPVYPKNKVSYKPFAEYIDKDDREQIAWSLRLWYLHEVEARAMAYREKYRDVDRYQIITTTVGELNDAGNVNKLLARLGVENKEDDDIVIPGRKNVTKTKRPLSGKDIKWVEEFVEAMG